MTVNELIAELEKVKNKDMEVTVKIGVHIVDAEDVFEIEADGVKYLCVDATKSKFSK